MFSGAFQPMHLLLVLIVVLILFGPGKLPDVGKALAKTIRDFSKSTSAVNEEEPEEVKAAQAQAIQANTRK